jgi:hypothetical protein
VLIAELKRLISRLVRPHDRSKHRIAEQKRAASLLEFDPSWHGDHWQNLLASPMDARHYVMEDWTSPTADATETSPAARSKGQRNSRRLH